VETGALSLIKPENFDAIIMTGICIDFCVNDRAKSLSRQVTQSSLMEFFLLFLTRDAVGEKQGR